MDRAPVGDGNQDAALAPALLAWPGECAGLSSGVNDTKVVTIIGPTLSGPTLSRERLEQLGPFRRRAGAPRRLQHGDAAGNIRRDVRVPARSRGRHEYPDSVCPAWWPLRPPNSMPLTF